MAYTPHLAPVEGQTPLNGASLSSIQTPTLNGTLCLGFPMVRRAAGAGRKAGPISPIITLVMDLSHHTVGKTICLAHK